MQLLQLRYFLALAENPHLKKVAHQLRIAPPSLSASLSRLEKELGVLLFDRTNSGLILTDSGKLFYKYVRQSIDFLDKGINLSSFNNIPVNIIKISITSSYLWDQLFAEFMEKYPNVFFGVHLNSLETINSSFQDDFFLGNIWDIKNPDQWVIRQIFPKETTYIMMSYNNKHSKKHIIDLKDMEEETFLSLGGFNPTSNNFFNRIFSLYDIHPKVINVDRFLRDKLIHENRGVSLATNLALASISHDKEIICRPISNQSIQRTQCIAWKKRKKLSSIENTFLKFIPNYFQSFKFPE